MNFKRRITLVSACVALALPLGAQSPTGTITGKVKDAAGAPIQGATVSITGTQSGAITVGAGTYRIALRPGRYELRVRLLGYAAAKDSVKTRQEQARE